jgi:hypothetical protein
MPVAADTFAIQRLVKGLTEGDTDVFNCVVSINLKVTDRMNVHIDQTMAGNLIQHVIQKRDAGLAFKNASTVKVDADADLRFFGIALDGSLTIDWLI